MLARSWSGAEATALWVELVAERKRDIEQNVDPTQIQGMAARIAAQQDISRSDLAKWDASARAWLLSADDVKVWEKTQLRLITKDCGMFVAHHGSTYASVIDVWTLAMTSLQKLILGMPQRISKAALLLGISAWHIHPDLNVIGPTVSVKFNDGLVAAGGVITLGLQSVSPDHDAGVQWSLSLSHLRFYGDPVQISKSGGKDDLRISMDDLHLVALGGLLGNWGNEPGEVAAGAEWLVALRDCFNRGANFTMKERLPWLDFLCTTANRFHELEASPEKENQRFLLSYGSRKARHFLDYHLNSNQIRYPLFGFLNRAQLANCSTAYPDVSDSDETLIGRLRDFAQRSRMAPGNGVIIYYQHVNPLERPKIVLATAVSYSPNDEGWTLGPNAVHTRWTTESCLGGAPNNKNYGEEHRTIRSSDLVLDQANSLSDLRSSVAGPQYQSPRLRWSACPSEFCDPNLEGNTRTTELYLVAGSITKVALFCTAGAFEELFHRPVMKRSQSNPTYSDLTEFFRSSQVMPCEVRHILDPDDLTARYGQDPGIAYRSTGWSVRKLMYATDVYNNLQGATVSISVVNKGLHTFGWAKSCHPYDPWFQASTPKGAIDFAVIATFETGTLDLDPSAILPVMALASGNSIYVDKILLQDPSEPRGSITRLLGSLDRPGVVFLVPPQAPMIREAVQSSWRLVNHSTFNGKVENAFENTSLHLSFTEYELPLNVSVGAVDAEAFMLETLVSVYDRETWVADLDILGAFDRSTVCPCASEYDGRSSDSSKSSIDDAISHLMAIAATTSKQLISIDCWEELLDPPDGLGESCIAMVRSGNNWNARLAALCVSVQKGYRTQVLPITKPLCINCSVSLDQMLWDTQVTQVFII